MSPKHLVERNKRALGRRQVLTRTLALGAGALAAPAVLRLGSGSAAAAEEFRVMGVSTTALEDWSEFERDTGMSMDFIGVHGDIGIITREIVVNEAGKRVDLIMSPGGIEDRLGTEGHFMPVDVTRLERWDTVSESAKASPVLYTPDGRQFGIPLVYNADSFAYFPEEIDETEPLSFALLFESEKTLGRSSIEDNWITTLPMAATYLLQNGRLSIGDPSDMTPDEARQVVDFLIERKQKGQYRALWRTWEESVDLLANREVIIENCWEPAVKALHRQGVNVRYAYTSEGYNKWMIAAYIPTQAAERGRLDQIYKGLNWFLGGAYAARIALLRGYATGNVALGLDYAKANNFENEQIIAIQENIEKVEAKYGAKWFWQNGGPKHLEAIEAEWERFRQA